MMKHQEITLISKLKRAFAIDVRWSDVEIKQPIVLFIHGFKGFKDAMHLNAIADEIHSVGFTFVKMNMSHNGVTPGHPMDFVDLEAFSENNFTKELDDIEVVLDFIESDDFPANGDPNKIFLIGHSRGGGISLIKSSEDARVKKLVTWAAVVDFARVWDEQTLNYWEEAGVIYIENSRTKQQMPLKFQMAEDYFNNRGRFEIESRVGAIQAPVLAIHGTLDETVPITSLNLLTQSNPKIKSHIIKGAGHTFGGKHPWTKTELPEQTKELIEHTVNFLRG